MFNILEMIRRKLGLPPPPWTPWVKYRWQIEWLKRSTRRYHAEWSRLPLNVQAIIEDWAEYGFLEDRLEYDVEDFILGGHSPEEAHQIYQWLRLMEGIE